VSTVAYNVEAGEQNPASPFTQTCGNSYSVGVARTAWYSIQGTGGQMTITTEGSDFDTALFVYSGSPAGALVTCNDDGPNIDFASSASFNSSPGVGYAIQAGTFCTALCSAPPSGGTLKILATAAPTPTESAPAGGSSGGSSSGSTPVAAAKSPETTIKAKPPAKTTAHQAKFSFTSSDQGAGFQCSLDGAGYKSCISPRIIHIGLGHHIFKVRASIAGLTDLTPASYSWKVVRRHRHRAAQSHR
jgi:hypothetical protein